MRKNVAIIPGSRNANSTPSIMSRCIGIAAVALVGLFGVAQAAKADPIVSVVNLDIASSAQAQAVAALKRYQSESRREAGNGEVLVLQEQFWGNRFTIYERWNSADALATHMKGAADRTLHETWHRLYGSPFDRRQFTPVNGSTRGAAADASTVYLKVHLDVLPRGLETTLAAVPAYAKATEALEGNLRFDLSQHAIRPTSHMTILTAWKSAAALDAFESSTGARDFRKAIGPWVGSPYDDRIYKEIKN